MFKRILSDLIEDIKKKETDKIKAQAANRDQEVVYFTAENASFKDKFVQKTSTLFKVDSFSGTLYFSCDFWRSNVTVRRIMRT